MFFFFFFFFSQAEDGIRDAHVTGVQTCALPIFQVIYLTTEGIFTTPVKAVANFVLVIIILGSVLQRSSTGTVFIDLSISIFGFRSEERRVGKECRSRWWRYH